ncbi:hypothetical protein [Mammaliicoccus fleurettii]|uniref:hypothetical protein n=1 Tax=Mammaliicoccus fleurettii TaxID=150056 RepID=UPI000993A7FD|nr:hypothetical protein [Mammaliicoccus fleurettii]OOV78886.1 hypothetical protein B2G86_00745 [Mammaliicoccus fleurettii]
MTYKYEESLKNRLLNLELDDYVEVIQLEKEYEELKEVYAKAKAYDQIKVIHDKHIYDFLNMSETECIEKNGDILEDK